MHPKALGYYFSLFALGSTLTTAGASAASAPAAPSAAAEQPIELSVFSVSASTDGGYAANEILSSGRVVTKIGDVANTVNVITREMLDDIGSFDLSSALSYLQNSQVDYFDDHVNQAINDLNFEGTGGSNVTVRNRGIAASRTLDYVAVDWNTDNYNLERLEVALGANGIMFGNGGPGGNINVSRARANTQRQKARAEFIAFSNGGYRAIGDWNIPIIKNKVAARILTLRSETEDWRPYSESNRRNLYGTLTLKPLQNTAVTLQAETGSYRAPSYFANGPKDDLVSAWIAAGKPIGSAGPVSATATFPGYGINPTRATAGVQVTAANFIYGGSVLVPTQRSNTRLADGTYAAPVIYQTSALPVPTGAPANVDLLTSRGIYDIFRTNVAGPDSYRTQHFHDYRATLEQKITTNIFLNAYAGVSRTDIFAQYQDRNFNKIYGAVNPDANAGKLYVEEQWIHAFNQYDRKTYGGVLAWSPEFKGTRHNLSFGAEKSTLDNYRNAQQYRDFAQRIDPVTGRPFSTVNANTGAVTYPGVIQINRRTYFSQGDVNGSAGYVTPIPGTFTDSTGTATYRQGFFPASYTNADFKDSTYRNNIVLYDQSFWFKNRLVTSVGYRKDRISTNRSQYNWDPLTQAAYYNGISAPLDIPFTGTSKSYGAVYHLNDRISVSAGYSQNVGDQQGVVALPDATRPAPSQGQSTDYAITVSTRDKRFSARAAYYDSVSVGGYVVLNSAFWFPVTGDPTFNTGTFASSLVDATGAPITLYRPLQPIIDSLAAQKIITPERASFLNNTVLSAFKGVTSISTPDGSKGYEFRLNGRLGNWDLTLNYSHTVIQRDGVGDEVSAFFDALGVDIEKLAANTAYPANLPVAAGTSPMSNAVGVTPKQAYDTVFANVVNLLDNQLDNRSQPWGNRPEKVSAVAKYTWREGLLKGLAATVRGNWQSGGGSARLVSFNDTKTRLVSRFEKGPPNYDAGLGLNYATKFLFWPQIKVRYSLDVDNLFNHDFRAVTLRYGTYNTQAIRGVGTAIDYVRDANGNKVGNRFMFQPPRSYRFGMRFEY
jgi:outer membrane receptor for ferric coprogen and ferric-rhodotorulic acid